MYDLMGKAAGVPVWQLIGQQQRKRVPVSAWFVSSPPEKMAEVVSIYAEMGHTWMKCVPPSTLPAPCCGAAP